MLSFKEYLLSLDESFKDIVKQKPHLETQLRQYKSALESSGHKYSDHMMHYLTREHEAGRLSPDHPDLHQTLSTLKTHVAHHGIKDPTKIPFDELYKSMKPHFDTSASKKDRAEEGRIQIHDDKPSGMTTYHVATKEASQHFYGGGENGPAKYGTSWCVSARSNNCLFNKKYGSMYTIHHKDPESKKERWFAYHPEQHVITSQKNDGEKPADDFIKDNPNFKRPIEAAKHHWESNKESTDSAPSKYDEHLNATSPIKLFPIVAGLAHQDREVKKRHIDKLMSLNSEDFSKAILDSKHPAISTEHVHKMARDHGHVLTDKESNNEFMHGHFRSMNHDQINELLNNKSSVLHHTSTFDKSLNMTPDQKKKLDAIRTK